ncbi:MAG: 4Fe-4S binding protein [Candidatus Bathyarchaeia archaeon]
MKLKLTFTHENINKPIISKVVLKTKIPINILEAKVTHDAGEMIVEVLAIEEKLEEVIKSFQDYGVIVEKIPSIIKIDYEKCISCGACISPCPVQAITLDSNWEIKFNEEKCIRCLICVNACPTKAIKIL